MPRVDGPFQILRKINNNAYQLDLQGKYDISSSFNVADLSPFLADEPDLWTNPFEEGGNDAPQSMNQDVESSQHGVQANRAVYRIDPRTSGKELRLDPRPDDRTDQDRLSRPSLRARTDNQTRLNSEHTEPGSDLNFSFLARLGLTTSADGHADGPSYYFDPIFEPSHQEFTKARIIHLSKDLGLAWAHLVREIHPKVPQTEPKCVLLLTAKAPLGFIKSGQGS